MMELSVPVVICFASVLLVGGISLVLDAARRFARQRVPTHAGSGAPRSAQLRSASPRKRAS